MIFQNSRSAQSLAILLATDSPFTHVGILDFDPVGNPVVLEAVRTARATPMQEWTRHGENGDVAIYRIDRLSEADALAVTEAARKHLGAGYDPYFTRPKTRFTAANWCISPSATAWERRLAKCRSWAT